MALGKNYSVSQNTAMNRRARVKFTPMNIFTPVLRSLAATCERATATDNFVNPTRRFVRLKITIP